MKNNNSSANVFIIHSDNEPDFLEERLKVIANLKKGWNYGEGIPINTKLIQTAKKIRNILKSNYFREYDAFPSVDGNLILVAYYNKYSFNLYIKHDSFILKVITPENNIIRIGEYNSVEELINGGTAKTAPIKSQRNKNQIFGGENQG